MNSEERKTDRALALPPPGWELCERGWVLDLLIWAPNGGWGFAIWDLGFGRENTGFVGGGAAIGACAIGGAIGATQ